MAIDYWHEFLPDHTYHVYNHAVSDQNIFNFDFDFTDFLLKYKKYISPFVNTYAYCLMPNHFHLTFKVKAYNQLVTVAKLDPTKTSLQLVKSEDHVNDFFLAQWKRMLSSYAIAYNNRNKRRGQLFLKRMKRVSIDEEVRLSYLIAYIHHNPIHHGFYKNYETWKHSSYKVYHDTIKSSNLDLDYVYKWFDGKDNMLKYHRDFKVLNWDDNLD